VVSIQDRLNTIQSYNNYIGHNINAEEINNAVLVTITSYRLFKNKAQEYVEMWIIPGANLETSDYLTMNAYPVNVVFQRKNIGVFFRHIRRWRRW